MWPVSTKIVRLNNKYFCVLFVLIVRDDLNSVEILKQCKSDFLAKIHEALLIKKHQPSLNKQLYANGSSFLLNVYK